jgi:hypothetical protein
MILMSSYIKMLGEMREVQSSNERRGTGGEGGWELEG